MAKKFDIHEWQAKQRLAEREEFIPDLEDDDLKRSKIQQMMAKEKEPMGGDEKLRSNVEAIANMYSYGEILDAIESFYVKNDEQVYAEMARKHAKEFRDFLDSEDELDEANMTGTGASFTPGTGAAYASPNAFGDNKRKKRKAYMGYKELNEKQEWPKGDIDWSEASDEEIRAVGGDVYYGDDTNKEPVPGRARMLVPPEMGWPQGNDLDGDGDVDLDDVDFNDLEANYALQGIDAPKDVDYVYNILLKKINNKQEYGALVRSALELDVPQKRTAIQQAFSDLPALRAQLIKYFGDEKDPTLTYDVDPDSDKKPSTKVVSDEEPEEGGIKSVQDFTPIDYRTGDATQSAADIDRITDKL